VYVSGAGPVASFLPVPASSPSIPTSGILYESETILRPRPYTVYLSTLIYMSRILFLHGHLPFQTGQPSAVASPVGTDEESEGEDRCDSDIKEPKPKSLPSDIDPSEPEHNTSEDDEDWDEGEQVCKGLEGLLTRDVERKSRHPASGGSLFPPATPSKRNHCAFINHHVSPITLTLRNHRVLSNHSVSPVAP